MHQYKNALTAVFLAVLSSAAYAEKIAEVKQISPKFEQVRSLQDAQLEKLLPNAYKSKEESHRKEYERRHQFAQLVEVTFVKTWVATYSSGKHQAMTIWVENKANQELRGISGKLVFRDLFGVSLGEFDVRVTGNVPVRGTFEWTLTRPYLGYGGHLSLTKVEKMNPEDYSVEFVPGKLIYANGAEVGE